MSDKISRKEKVDLDDKLHQDGLTSSHFKYIFIFVRFLYLLHIYSFVQKRHFYPLGQCHLIRPSKWLVQPCTYIRVVRAFTGNYS